MAALNNSSENAAPTVAVGGIVFDTQQRVLLIRRGQPPAQGLWSIPGGKQEPDESLVEACMREIKEETGLVTEVKSLVAVVERRLEGFHYVIIDFLALPADDGFGDPIAGTDVTAACWVGMDRIASYPLVAGLDTILRQARRIYAGEQQSCPGLLPNNMQKTDFVATNKLK